MSHILPSATELKRPEPFVQKILLSTALYFICCGVTAIFWQESWYFVSGIEPQPFNLTLSITGVMMLALGYGAYLASYDATGNSIVIKMLIAANLFDFLLLIYFALAALLPLYNSLAFMAIDASWCIALYFAQRRLG